MTSCATTTARDARSGSMRTGNFDATGMRTRSPAAFSRSYCAWAISDCKFRKLELSSSMRRCAARNAARSDLSRAPSCPGTSRSVSSFTVTRKFATSCSDSDSAVTAFRIADDASWSIVCDAAFFARSASCADRIAAS
eukprot:30395-Pelagococcus_subviridis.AAC.4